MLKTLRSRPRPVGERRLPLRKKKRGVAVLQERTG